jgi:hypothetical protein
MVKLTQSLQHWLWLNHKELIPLIMFGHTELFTEEMQKEYLEWCQTEEGNKYLKGGSEYREVQDE